MSSESAKRAWKTIRENYTEKQISGFGKKAWNTRQANAKSTKRKTNRTRRGQ